MTPSILVTAPLGFLPDLQKRMKTETNLIYAYDATRDEVIELLESNKFVAWMVSPCPTYLIDGSLLDLCPTLEIVATPSTGSNHVSVEYLKKKGIQFYSLKGSEVVNEIVASSEFTFNLMISVIRSTPWAFRAVEGGRWREVESKYRGRELRELSLGIIGYGRIGSNLAKYSNTFGMTIYAYDPYIEINDERVTQVDSLEEMLPQVDVVAVCVHLNDETFHMVDNSLFSMMKKGVYFINTSRGDVVNEDHFLKYLENGKIKAAGIDVISDEFTGDKHEHKLIAYARTHENLLITPHIAGLTYDSERKAQTAAYEAIKAKIS